MLCYDPNLRISAKDALQHAYFHNVQHVNNVALPVDPNAGNASRITKLIWLKVYAPHYSYFNVSLRIYLNFDKTSAIIEHFTLWTTLTITDSNFISYRHTLQSD